MRPLKLEMRGFGVFREAVEIDFEDTDVFALIGPTGSGKSTVIDAICFALYGKVPRMGNAPAAGSVTSVGAVESVVRLTFQCGAERYVVVRVLRGGRTREVRVERLAPDGSTETLAAQARPADAALESIVGLPFEHFTRCVVLPQGEFARFLHDEPKDRRALLVRLLDLGMYETMRRRADELARSARLRAELLAEQLGALVVAGPSELEAWHRRLGALGALDDDLIAVGEQIAVLDRELEASARQRETDDRLRSGLDRIAVPIGAADLGRRLAAAADELATARVELEQARLQRDRRAADLQPGPDVATIRSLLVLHERVERGRGVIERLRAELRDAERLAASADEEAGGSLHVLSAALARREQAHRDHAVHALAGTLVAGASCPVCAQVVERLPVLAPPAVLAVVDAEVARAEAESVAAARSRDAAREAAHAAATTLSQADGHLAALLGQISDRPDHAALVALLEVREADEDALRELGAHAAARETALTAAERVATAVRAEIGGLSRSLHEQRDRVAALAPPMPTDDVLASWQELAEWALAVRSDFDAASATSDARRREMAVERNRLVEGVSRRFSLLDLAFGDLAGARSMLARAVAETEGRLEAARFASEQAERLTAEQAAAHQAGQLAGQLAQHLRSDRFQDWLVTESLDVLASSASGLLVALSAGQFSLRYESGEFLVVDHRNGDELRSARTLSGGETFQASLALALALADHLASRGTRSASALDSIMLDEGFGTLDAESLETVAATIESLGVDGRMVGIVTHVRELAERAPVRYVVARGPRGSTVERQVG